MNHFIDYLTEHSEYILIDGHTYHEGDKKLLASWTAKLQDSKMTIVFYKGSISEALLLEYLYRRRIAIEIGVYQSITYYPTYSRNN